MDDPVYNYISFYRFYLIAKKRPSDRPAVHPSGGLSVYTAVCSSIPMSVIWSLRPPVCLIIFLLTHCYLSTKYLTTNIIHNNFYWIFGKNLSSVLFFKQSDDRVQGRLTFDKLEAMLYEYFWCDIIHRPLELNSLSKTLWPPKTFFALGFGFRTYIRSNWSKRNSRFKSRNFTRTDNRGVMLEER